MKDTSETGASPRRTASSPKDKAAIAYWNSHISPILPELDLLSHSPEQLCPLVDQLWSALSEGGFLGRSGGVGGSKRRSTALRTVFRLLDSKDPKLLLKVAKILFGVSNFVY